MNFGVIIKSQTGRSLVIITIIFSVLYGVSYQQFRHFDVSDPRGIDDSRSYISMSHGDYNVNPVHKYRFVIPEMVNLLRMPMKHVVKDETEQDKTAFYIVNFAFVFATAVLLMKLLHGLGFSPLLTIIGVLMFISSRITVLTTGCPLIDSFFLFSMVAILHFSINGNAIALAILLPFLALSKETIIPFLFLPLFTKTRASKYYLISLPVSLGAIFLTRLVIGHIPSADNPDLCSIISEHLRPFFHNFLHLFSLAGLHDFQNGFSFILLLAIVGWIINRKLSLHKIPLVIIVTIPISIFYALLSGNTGRMIFISFSAVIPLALICIEYAFQNGEQNPINPNKSTKNGDR